jgi:hypothetical protein
MKKQNALVRNAKLVLTGADESVVDSAPETEDKVTTEAEDESVAEIDPETKDKVTAEAEDESVAEIAPETEDSVATEAEDEPETKVAVIAPETEDKVTAEHNSVTETKVVANTDCDQYDNQKREDARRRKKERRDSVSNEERAQQERKERQDSESNEQQESNDKRKRREDSESNEHQESNDKRKRREDSESNEHQESNDKRKRREKRTRERPNSEQPSETEDSFEMLSDLMLSFNKILITLQTSPGTLMSVVDGEVKRIHKILIRSMLDGSFLKSLSKNPFDPASQFPKFIRILTSGSPLYEQTSMISGMFGASNPLLSLFTSMLSSNNGERH